MKKKLKQRDLPTNETAEKNAFLQRRKTPDFVFDLATLSMSRRALSKTKSIRFDLFNDSKRILDLISKEYNSFDNYIAEAFGKELNLEAIQDSVSKYLQDRKLTDIVFIRYVKNISCSAKLNSLGYEKRLNKPEFRKYNLLINIRPDNVFLREHGIECLLDHEIGTHFVRAYNEGFQPWYWNRRRFHLSSLLSYEYKQIEEGLATINTTLAANKKYLGTSALLYYATCMSHFLSFGQLFDHLGKYINNVDYRWRQCVRIKKNLKNVNDTGGYAKDQCYFEGAHYLLANLKNIDFDLLYRGKLTVKDLSRVKRISRNCFGQIPTFMKYVDKYVLQLTSIANINGILIISKENKVMTGISSLTDDNNSVLHNNSMGIAKYLQMTKINSDTKPVETKSKATLPKIEKIPNNSKYSRI